MKKVLYFDCFSGAAGDMLCGALLDLGIKLSALEYELGKLDLPEKYHLHASRAERQSIAGVHFVVHGPGVRDCGHGSAKTHSHSKHEHHHTHGEDHHHHHDHDTHAHGRTYAEIKQLIEKSDLSAFVKEKAVAVFHRVAVAEGKIHGMPPEKVHFHEVGALDSIIDIVSFCVLVEKLGSPAILASPLVDGTGIITCAHGTFPVPAPATLEILAETPLTQVNEPHELLTPTGAALLKEFAISFAPMQNIKPEKIGYGLGTRELASRPNVVRAILGEQVEEQTAAPAGSQTDTVAVLETNLDDCTGEIIADTQERLFAAGALDVYYVPIQMKKNRPGILLSVIASPEKIAALEEIMLTHTTAFGVRRTAMTRSKLRREIKTVQTEFGPVEVKYGYFKDKLVQVAPEMESCKKLAEKKKISVGDVFAAVRRLS